MANPSGWTKPDPALVERFDAALPDHPAAERRKMFGYPACFVNGHFFTGLHQAAFVIRLPGNISDRFPELAGASWFGPMGTGKPMKDWYQIPAHIADDQDRLASLLDAAIGDIASLPPKEPRKPKARRKAGR